MENNKDLVIDADAHVVECARTWEFMDPSEQQLPAHPARNPRGGRVSGCSSGSSTAKCRGFRFPAFSAEELAKRAQQVGRKFADAQEARELGNVDLRLEHMDETGVDVQVLHNTMFIESATDRAAVEVALCKSWNRWLADIWKQGKGRLRWSCMAPTLSMPDALDQIRWSQGKRRRARFCCGRSKASACSPIRISTRSMTKRRNSTCRSRFTSPTAIHG